MAANNERKKQTYLSCVWSDVSVNFEQNDRVLEQKKIEREQNKENEITDLQSQFMASKSVL